MELLKGRNLLTGIFPVLPTPYRADGAVDPVAMRRLARFALECGVSGVVYPGAASEVEELNSAERGAMLEIIADETRGKVALIAGGSAATAADSIARLREAAALGTRIAMVQAPASIGTTAEPLVRFYSDIAAALPDFELVLQNAPPPRGSNLDPETILAIVRRVPTIRYVKEETLPSGRAITAILADKPDNLYGVMGGGGARYLLEELRRGACGAMPAVEIVDVHVALYKAFQRGDLAGARQLYMRTLPLLLIQAIFRMRLTKNVLRRRGLLENVDCRSKLPEFDATDHAEIDAWLADIADITGPIPALDAWVPA